MNEACQNTINCNSLEPDPPPLPPVVGHRDCIPFSSENFILNYVNELLTLPCTCIESMMPCIGGGIVLYTLKLIFFAPPPLSLVLYFFSHRKKID